MVADKGKMAGTGAFAVHPPVVSPPAPRTGLPPVLPSSNGNGFVARETAVTPPGSGEAETRIPAIQKLGAELGAGNGALSPVDINIQTLAPLRSPATEHSFVKLPWLLLIAVLGALIAAVAVLVALHRRPAKLATPAQVTMPTFAEIVVSPSGRLMQVQAEGGAIVPLPSGEAVSPLRLTGLRPGTYLVALQASDGHSSTVRCVFDATHHLCFAQLAPLSDADLALILKGASAP